MERDDLKWDDRHPQPDRPIRAFMDSQQAANYADGYTNRYLQILKIEDSCLVDETDETAPDTVEDVNARIDHALEELTRALLGTTGTWHAVYFGETGA